MRSLLLRALLVLVATAALLTGPAQATWTQLAKLSFRNSPATAITFLDELTGWAGTDAAVGLAIAKTTDGGVTWTKVPLAKSQNASFVSDIFMVDGLNGWATVETGLLDSANGLFNNGLFRTTDAGDTWTIVPVMNDASSVVQIGNTVYVTSRRVTPVQVAKVSTDGGNTWRDMTLTSTNMVDFIDPMIGMSTRYEDGLWHRTTNGGNTWTPMPATLVESWSVYAEKGTSRFYATPESDPRNRSATGGTTVIRSLDAGQTWSNLVTLGFYGTGDIQGFGDLLYMQVEEGEEARAAAGIYRSSDRGQTWIPVGGPFGKRDSRFAVTGCNGGVIFASDENGSIWKSRDGGDGAITEPPVLLKFDEDSVRLASLVCASTTFRVNFTNEYCAADSVVSIAFLDPLSPVIASGALRLGASPSLPKVYLPQESDFFELLWDPSKLVDNDTTLRTKIVIRYYSTLSKRFIDMTVEIVAEATGEPPSMTVPSPLALNAFDACRSIDTTIEIRNTSCDTVSIRDLAPSGTMITLTDVNGNALVYPIRVAPDSIFYVRLEYSSTVVGPFAGSISLVADHQRIPGIFTIQFAGDVTTTPPEFVISHDPNLTTLDSSVLDRGSMTRCDPPQEFYLYVSNPGCMSFALRNVIFEIGGPIFAARAERAFPDTLQGGETHRITITVDPRLLGTNTDRLRIRYKEGNQPSVDMFYPMTVDVGYGTRTLALTTEDRDLGIIPYCESKDETITLENRGCDTMTLTALDLQGLDYEILSPTQFPILLAPQTSRTIDVRFTPLLPGRSTGDLTVSTDADTDPQRTIRVLGEALPTDTASFYIRPEREYIARNDTLLFHVYPTRTVSGKGLSSLSFKLRYNGDVLTYMGSFTPQTGVNLLPTMEGLVRGKLVEVPLVLKGSDIALDSLEPLITVEFRTTLSDSTQATLSLESLFLNDGDGNFGKCLLGARSEPTTIDLALFCGDTLISEFMRSGRFILSLLLPHPNPVTGGSDVKIPVLSAVNGTLEIKVYDQNGDLVHQHRADEQAGETQFLIDGDKLSSGRYNYEVTLNGMSPSRGQFIVTP